MSPFKSARTAVPAPAPRAEVIDLNAGPTTRIVLDADLTPFDRLDPEARRRLLVRVLCELVAYDEITAAASPMASV